MHGPIKGEQWQGENFWSLPLKDSVDCKPYIAALKIPRGPWRDKTISTDTYTSDFVAKYGKLKKKPKDVKVDYRTARGAFKAIF